MKNLELYDKVRSVPKEAQREIAGGKLKGKTDINPMWRIKTLTEQFGPCGIGWYYEITRQWLEQGANGEIAGFCNINLFVKIEEKWSAPIPGTGGSAFIAKTKNGLENSDEVHKMALTDAISVACKALGIGADIYWAADRTKYDRQSEVAQTDAKPVAEEVKSTVKESKPAAKEDSVDVGAMVLDIMSSNTKAELTDKWKLYHKYDIDSKITNAIIARRKELGV